MDRGAVLGGRYELAELIGSGGSGAVWRGRDALLDRPVAVKRLRSGQDAVMRARLRTEARLAGRLQHPGIAQVFDFGEDVADSGEATPYIVMQHVDGTPLSEVLRERRTLPVTEVLAIVTQVAQALEAAHAAGIVHRDLKPGNILVTAEDGRAVLVDFGIARTLDAEPLTATGTLIGTADYISPEQSAGGSATPLSDLYSLGLVAYECLTGHKPFHRESQVATVLAHLNDDVPALGEEVPAGVRELVGRLVARRPGDRPRSAAAVARWATALAEHPDAGWRPTEESITPAPRRRRRLVADSSRASLVGAALVLAVLVSGLFVASRPASSRVPDVRGLQVAKAAATLEGRGLEVRRRLVDDPGSPRGTVLTQDPAPGSRADDGTVVVLEVASGMVDLEPAGLLGATYERAARRVVRLGLVPARATVERVRGAGTVVDVSRLGRLPLGATVVLTQAVAPEPVAPDPVAPAVRASGPGHPTDHGKLHNKPKPAKSKGHGHRH